MNRKTLDAVAGNLLFKSPVTGKRCKLYQKPVEGEKATFVTIVDEDGKLFRKSIKTEVL